MTEKILRLFLGFALILLIFPPMSLGVINLFVLIPGIAGLILIFLPSIKTLLKKISGKRYKLVSRSVLGVLIAAGVFFITEFAIIYSSSFAQKAPGDSVAIVLGAKVEGDNPTILLLGRINAAGKFLKDNPKAVCIATGGKGADENISEAKCIKDWLVLHYGIDEKRIFTDETSTDTEQNFQNAVKIMKENNLPEDAAVVTDGFHMFRAKMIAERQGVKAYSCPAATDSRLTLTFYLRELFALPKSVVFDR
jgi:uncharacterized SAM-binding protein YcdF (DUF218 family)